jgi:solute carrier family 35 protein F5
VLISSSKIELEHEDDSTMVGAAWALVSAMCYAIYLVLLLCLSGDNLNIPMFFGFVGMFIMLMFWPGLVVMHLTGVETFQLPTREQVLYLGLNGLIGTVICELIWLYACFLTSPLQGTLALSLINPGSIVANYLIRNVAFGSRFLLGSFFNMIGYLGITLLNAKGRPNKKTERSQSSANTELEELISS